MRMLLQPDSWRVEYLSTVSLSVCPLFLLVDDAPVSEAVVIQWTDDGIYPLITNA